MSKGGGNTTEWTARLRGTHLPHAGGGCVVSTHKTAVNLLHTDGFLVSLVVSADHMTARTVLLDRLPGPLLVDTIFKLSGDTLSLGRYGRINLSQARPWNGSIETHPPALLGSELVVELGAALLKEGKPGGLLGLLDPRDGNPFAKRAREILDTGQDLVGLVGLGPGFTPSGDDFLTGVLLSAELAIADFTPTAVSLARRTLFATTAGGRTLLALALCQSFPAYLLRLAADLCSSIGTSDVGRAVRRAAAFGETSGTDAMVGLVWSLSGSRAI